MFDLGWTELLLIGIVALIVVGPKDLPGLFRSVGRFVGKAKGMAREFSRAMEDAADESGMREVDTNTGETNTHAIQFGSKHTREFLCLAMSQDYELCYAGTTSGDVSTVLMKNSVVQSMATSLPASSDSVGLFQSLGAERLYIAMISYQCFSSTPQGA